MSIEDQLKQAAKRSGSILALSKASGVAYSITHGFVTGDRLISIRNAAKLAAALGLELRPIAQTRGKGRKAKGAK